MKDWLMEHKFFAAAAALILLAGFYYFDTADQGDPVPSNSLTVGGKGDVKGKAAESNKQEDQAEKTEKIMVDVKGQIKQPGVYMANAGERVIDLISRAGGLTEQADQGQVNFAQHVEDEMVIYIPAKGEEGVMPPAESGSSTAVTNGSGKTQGKINVNKASESELQELPGIGPAKAAAIIEYRETSGPFNTVEDLKNVSGIGDKTFEKLKELAVVH